jgi:hypothetical protein
MALNPSGAISLAGPSAGQSIAVELGVSATATISLNDTNVRTLAQVPSGVIVMPTDFWGKSNITGTQKAIFGFGLFPTNVSTTNLVSSTGVVASDTPGVGTARSSPAAAGYGGDKAIFGYGNVPANPLATAFFNITNLVSNTGVVASNTPGVGTARGQIAAAGYGNDKAIFGYGRNQLIPSGTEALYNITNLVSNTGVVASDTPGVGTARFGAAAAGYGGDKAIFGFGRPTPTTFTSLTNLVSNTGVVAADATAVGTARTNPAAAGYGNDKAIFGYGQNTPTTTTSLTNLVSNTGVVASNTPGVGTSRAALAAAGYGGDKAIFGYGYSLTPGLLNQSLTNLVSNTGVVASDTPGVGTARRLLAAAGYSTTA